MNRLTAPRSTSQLLSACLVLTWAQALQAHTAAEAMAQAASRFLVSLDPPQREQAQFRFTDPERQNWNFVPMERAGLPLKDMQPQQAQYALALLHSALSHEGFSKALNIMALEQILRDLENGSPNRDPSRYFFLIFGEPSAQSTWGWRVEGHHLSVSLTLVNGQEVVATPSFYGANPAHVKDGPHTGLRVLADEEDLGRKLVQALSEDQQKTAIIETTAPKDIINGPGRKATPLEPLGLSAAEMTNAQRQLLMQLVRTYVFNLRPELAREDLQKIRQSGVRNLNFAWAGSREVGQGHYYRVQGPTFILEYDNTQNDANHIHCVWRDFENDFGEDLLKKHYAEVPHDE
jgi:hypothetical protein